MALLWSPALLPLISTRRIHNNNNQQVDRDDDREAALKQFFSPRSVAVVGASNAPSKVGHAVVSNLVEHGFAGQIYPVNPRAKADTLISGRRAYPSLAAVPGAVELAVIAVPARAVAGVLEDAGEKGVKGAIVISSGFREASAAGVQVEQQLLAIAAKHGIRLLGPNCLGVIDTGAGGGRHTAF